MKIAAPASRQCRQRVLRLAALLLVLAGGAGHAREEHIVEDPHYGEVLFHFYQRDYFTAITRLLAARDQGRVPRHQSEAELLEGGLKLSYGMHRDAASIFNRVLDQQTEAAVRNRAWFYLAKLAYQRGFAGEAAESLERIEGRMAGGLEHERSLLRALVAMDRGDDAGAIAQLEDWSGPRDWEAYARFNLGVALVRAGRREEGIDQLERVGGMRVRSAEMANLRDKANLAGGYTLLQEGRPEPAREMLARVRLEGPFASRALLGFGWADLERGAYERALAPWMALGEREPNDVAVQEALLAVPFALSKLDAPGRAARRYETAIASFLDQAASLEAAIDEVRRGALLGLLGRAVEGADGGWFWELSDVPATPLTRNLSELLASHGFQEALRNYRDLRFLQDNLDAWAQALGSFDEMLAARRTRYEQTLPRVDAYEAGLDTAALHARLEALSGALARAESHDDGLALATSAEQAQSGQLEDLKERISALGPHPSLEEAQIRQRFLRGVLHWELQAAVPARRWEVEKGLREIEAALEETEQRLAALDHAKDEAPAGFEGYADRIAEARRRVGTLRPAVTDALAAQRQWIDTLAIEALRDGQRRLKTYAVQARFSLARIYDQVASDAGDKP